MKRLPHSISVGEQRVLDVLRSDPRAWWAVADLAMRAEGVGPAEHGWNTAVNRARRFARQLVAHGLARRRRVDESERSQWLYNATEAGHGSGKATRD